MARTTPRVGSLDYYLSEIPEGRELSLVWARALAITGEEKYRKFFEKYDSYKRAERESVALEVCCAYAKLDPADYLGDFVRTAKKYSTVHIDIMKVAMLPDVIRKSYETARTSDDFDDRHAILQQEGHHHAPKANQINIQQNQIAGGYEDMASFTHSLEELEQPKQLPAASTEFIDGSIVTSDEKVSVER